MSGTINFATLTLKDALDLAILIEEEAEERYDELSKQVGGRYVGDASDFFKMMAGAEAKHGKQLKEQRRGQFGDADSSVDRSMIWQVEAPDYGKARVFMSPRQAMDVALDSEKKAHAFFDEALPAVKDADVRALFEELRAEELEHQRLISERMVNLPAEPDVHEHEADEPGAH